jgi:formate hydrogenlyase subunit 3/multisubunit Na+/H+ antiporter MnhD subunit
MDVLYYIILLPILAGIVLFLLPERLKAIKALFALIVSIIVLYLGFVVYAYDPQTLQMALGAESLSEGSLLKDILAGAGQHTMLHLDPLSQLITLFTGIFAVVIAIYSGRAIHRKKEIYHFYSFFLITLGCAIGAVLADSMLLFIFFWGILGFTLYKLIKGQDEKSSAAAKKTLIIIGASDGIMILGIAIIWQLTGTWNMSELNMATSSPLETTAFLTLMIGAFTKAGAFPFHSWIPDFAQHAPASSTAYLPASLDKLLGIYFLTRICVDLFRVNQWLTLILIILAVLTILVAVMMALIQHNFKRLLSFHAVSQVGYMILGIAIATPLGVAAGLFHMVNHALYKSGLFLSAGSVQDKTGKTDLDELGGLSSRMPVTFFSALVFALAISGIPPLNGFASKWMIYQGIIDFGHGTGIASQLWIIWLAGAVLGSALTLASFIKFISGIFLGRRPKAFDNLREVNLLMWLPKLLLAILCIGFGVFATTWVVPTLFESYSGNIQYIGVWQSATVSILVLVYIVLGVLIYLAGNIKNMRVSESYIGGEAFREDAGYQVTEFYNTIRELKPLKGIYQAAQKGWFDLYVLFKKLFYGLNIVFSKVHTGVMTAYAIWIFAGFIIIMLLLL